jgi:hypothetical protein
MSAPGVPVRRSDEALNGLLGAALGFAALGMSVEALKQKEKADE